jgi:DNA adenine methylase
MKQEKINRSPLFYVGDKYKLIRAIRACFPRHINRFFEPFVGGGSVFLNTEANEFFLNDVDPHVIEIHHFLCSYLTRKEDFFRTVFSLIDRYELSFSLQKDLVPPALKKQYKKTYYSRFNLPAYCRLRDHYNQSTVRDTAELYLLLIYGFNRMLRFNKEGNFNLPVGNVDFNKNVYDALCGYFTINANRNIRWSTLDFKDFLRSATWQEDDFVYLDPPYLITFSEYNKLWNEQTEKALLSLLDELNRRNVPFAISNVTRYKGKENRLFLHWAEKYYTHKIASNYISYHDNTIKDFTEVLVTNYRTNE